MMRARRLCPQAVVIKPDHAAYAVTAPVSWRSSGRSPLWSSRCRSTRRSSRCPGPRAGWAARATWGSGSGPPSRTSKASPARSGSPPLSSSPSWPPRTASRTGCCGAGRRGRRLPAPAAGRRAVGRGREDRGGARPAGPAHRRRPRPHPPGDPAARPRPGDRRPPVGAVLGARRAAGGRPSSRTRASAPRRPSPATWTTPRSSPASCCACPSGPRPGCARRGRSAAPSRSRSGSPTSRRSPARGPCPRRPTSDGRLRDRPRALRRARARARPAPAGGVRVEGMADGRRQPHQLLLGERESGWREAEQAADRAARRFGAGAVRPAALVGPAASGPRSRPPRRPPARHSAPSGTGRPTRRMDLALTSDVPPRILDVGGSAPGPPDCWS